MKPLFALVAGVFIVASAAIGQPNVPRVPPAIAQRATQQNDVLFWYNRLPARHFAALGNANREELARQKGAIYNANQGYIEVPAPGDPDKNDVEKLQIKLYRAQAGLVVAVSLNVWNQPRVPGELTLYGVTDNGELLDVTQRLFPYKLEPVMTDDGKISAYPNAVLPRAGTTITVSVPDSKEPTSSYEWNGNQFVIDGAPVN